MKVNPINPLCLALVLLVSAGQACAIGLGEITVQNTIGQPLNAVIPLIEADANFSENCADTIPAQDGSLHMPDHIQIHLENSSNNQTRLLRLRTTRAIHEPAIGFTVRIECGAKFKRDYVALLDPPATGQPAHEPARPNAITTGFTDHRAYEASSRATQPLPPPGASQKKSARTTQQRTKPQLVLSGNTNRPGLTGVLSLRLDTHLSTPTQAAAQAGVALHDENTALLHKLDYLERQLVSLQKRNIELETRLAAPKAPQQSASNAFSLPPNWTMALLGLFISGTGVAWLLHRRRTPPPEQARMEYVPKPAQPAAQPSHFHEFDSHPLNFHESSSTEIREDLEDAVEVFVAHQHGDLAIQLLEEEIRATPKASPTPWLLLLDLLHQQKKTDRYEATRQACKQYYNLDMPAYGDILVFGKKGLETYPHLVERLCKLWALPDASVFLDTLLHDSRDGARTGFGLETFHEILFLKELHKLKSALPDPVGLDFSDVRGLHR